MNETTQRRYLPLKDRAIEALASDVLTVYGPAQALLLARRIRDAATWAMEKKINQVPVSAKEDELD